MKRSLFIISLLIITSGLIFSQDAEKISPYVALQYFKGNSDSSYLKATLTYSKNRMELPLPGMEITFFSGTGGEKTLMKSITDDKGVSKFNISDSKALTADKDGMWPFSISYEGNDSIEAGSAEILIRESSLNMELTDIDSIKTVNLHAEKLVNGKMVPVAGEMLTVYVPRSFSLLPVGEVTLDDAGSGTLEFPSDLPGDRNGEITVIARFEEHPEFGNIEKSVTLKWGMPLAATNHSSHRALWTKTAPKWMIYTLSILLIGVWAHYLFAIISLIRIRIDARRKEEKELFIK